MGLIVGTLFWRARSPLSAMSTHEQSPETRLTSAELGFQQFRAGQLEAASAILTFTDVVVKLPTSGGKSLATFFHLCVYLV